MTKSLPDENRCLWLDYYKRDERGGLEGPFNYHLTGEVMSDPVWWGVVEVDYKGDKTKLIQALKETGSEVMFHLADMLDRYDLVKKVGRPPLPSYERTIIEHRLEVAKVEAQKLIANGMDRDEAITVCSNKYYDPRLGTKQGSFINRLQALMIGKDSAINRKNKRRPPRAR